MPVSRKSSVPSNGSALKPGPTRYPRRVVVYVVVRDESGSMAPWRQQQGNYIPAVAKSLIERGGPKVGELVYILYAIVSGGVVTTEFVPLAKAADPSYQPDGQTPIGTALKVVAEKCEAFLHSQLFPNEVSVRNFEVLIVSDLQATGESSEETNGGVNAFVEFAKKNRAKVTVVGPAREVMNGELAARLDINERGVKFLDSDPAAVLQITFDSLLDASRTSLGGSNPSIRIQ